MTLPATAYVPLFAVGVHDQDRSVSLLHRPHERVGAVRAGPAAEPAGVDDAQADVGGGVGAGNQLAQGCVIAYWQTIAVIDDEENLGSAPAPSQAVLDTEACLGQARGQDPVEFRSPRPDFIVAVDETLQIVARRAP